MQKSTLYQLLNEKYTALDSNAHMNLLNNFPQHMIFMLTSVFNVSRIQRQKKSKNDTKFANLSEMKAIVNKNRFHLRYFALLF